MLNLFLNLITPTQYEPISTYCCDDICFKIFRQVAGNFEEDNLNKLAVCQLTSKKVYPLIKPLWQLVRKEMGLNVPWNICLNTRFPETYTWLLNHQIHLLVKSIFQTRFYHSTNPAFNPEKIFKKCKYLLESSAFLTNSFAIITHKNYVYTCSKRKALEEKFVEFISPNDVGEQLLQLLVDAKKTLKGELNFVDLDKIIKKETPNTLPFILKIFLSLKPMHMPIIKHLLTKAVELWKSGYNCLEIMLEDLWKESNNEEWFFIFLNEFYENPSNQVEPISFILAALIIRNIYNKALQSPNSTEQEFINYETKFRNTIETIIDKIAFYDIPERFLSLILKLINNVAIIDPLDERSPITDLFLPLLLKKFPNRSSVILHGIKQEIRSGLDDNKIVSVFIDYLKDKYGYDAENAETAQDLLNKMSKDELEILHFFQLKIKDPKFVELAYRGYKRLIIKCKMKQENSYTKLHIRYLFGLIEAKLKLGKFEEAKKSCLALLIDFDQIMTPEQKIHRDVFFNIIEIFEKDDSLSAVESLFAIDSKFLISFIKIVIFLSFDERYLFKLRQVLEKSIEEWLKEKKKYLEEILELLCHNENPWTLKLLTMICENPTYKIEPIIFALDKELLQTK